MIKIDTSIFERENLLKTTLKECAYYMTTYVKLDGMYLELDERGSVCPIRTFMAMVYFKRNRKIITKIHKANTKSNIEKVLKLSAKIDAEAFSFKGFEYYYIQHLLKIAENR